MKTDTDKAVEWTISESMKFTDEVRGGIITPIVSNAAARHIAGALSGLRLRVQIERQRQPPKGRPSRKSP